MLTRPPSPIRPRGSEVAERRLDLSNNSFSGGPFPLWLVEQLFAEKDACGKCVITVKGERQGRK